MLAQKLFGLLQQYDAMLDDAELVIRIGYDGKPMGYLGVLQRLVHDFGLLEGHLRVHGSMQHQQRRLEFGGMQMR
jgi:hypothetical protein